MAVLLEEQVEGCMCRMVEGVRARGHAGGDQQLPHGRRTGFPQRDWDGWGSMCDVGVGGFRPSYDRRWSPRLAI